MILKEIGVIHSLYKEKGDAPRQGRLKDNLFEIEIHEEYLPCLKDLETVSHLIVLYWADKADREIYKTNTPFDDNPHGVFATRSPNRPNPINLNVVKLISVKDNIITVDCLDALDKSPLLDIKPYSPKIDCVEGAVVGWKDNLEKNK